MSFFSLAAELRIEIYRYCLVAHEPIHPRPPEKANSPPSKLAPNLLQTCRQIYTESAEFLYGENELRFQEENSHLDALDFFQSIDPAHHTWLRNITISTPFMGMQVYTHSGSQLIDSSWDDIVPTDLKWLHGSYRTSSTTSWGELATSLLQLLSSFPRLQTLKLVRPPDWSFRNMVEGVESGARRALRRALKFSNLTPLPLDREVIWTGLQELIRAKPYLKLIIVCAEDDFWGDERYLRNMRRRLGIWDVRKVSYHRSEMWDLPAATEEDPDEWLRDLKRLFA